MANDGMIWGFMIQLGFLMASWMRSYRQKDLDKQREAAILWYNEGGSMI